MPDRNSNLPSEERALDEDISRIPAPGKVQGFELKEASCPGCAVKCFALCVYRRIMLSVDVKVSREGLRAWRASKGGLKPWEMQPCRLETGFLGERFRGGPLLLGSSNLVYLSEQASEINSLVVQSRGKGMSGGEFSSRRIRDRAVGDDVGEAGRFRDESHGAAQTREDKQMLKYEERMKKAVELDKLGEFQSFHQRELVKCIGREENGFPVVVMFGRRLPLDNSTDLEHVIMYLILSLHDIVNEKYVFIYCHTDTKLSYTMFSWLGSVYASFPRKFKKNLARMCIVHPSFWVKSFINFIVPFVSPKFWKKFKYVSLYPFKMGTHHYIQS